MDFKSAIYNKPMNLLQSIKEHLLSYEEDRYEMDTTVDSFKDYFQYMQLNVKSLLDYARRFKVAREVLTSYIGGPIELKKHIQD